MKPISPPKSKQKAVAWLATLKDEIQRLSNHQEGYLKKEIPKAQTSYEEQLKGVQEKLSSIEKTIEEAKNLNYNDIKKACSELSAELQEMRDAIKKWQRECNQWTAIILPNHNQKLSYIEQQIKPEDSQYADIAVVKTNIQTITENVRQCNELLSIMGKPIQECEEKLKAIKEQLKAIKEEKDVEGDLKTIQDSSARLIKALTHLNNTLSQTENDPLKTKAGVILLTSYRAINALKLWEFAAEPVDAPTPLEPGAYIHVDSSRAKRSAASSSPA
jgi:chromosome segregation ATPase